MSKKTNTLPTVSIKGQQYVLVKDRITEFNRLYPDGSITTEIVPVLSTFGKWVIKATVTPDYKNPSRVFTGHSQADSSQGMINKTAGLENAETSATGRALAMMGIGVIDSIASVDEMHKAGVSSGDRQAVQAQNAKTISKMAVNPKDVEESLTGEPLPWEGDTPPCDVCGQPTTHKTGTSSKGKDWEALFCSSGERDHAKWL